VRHYCDLTRFGLKIGRSSVAVRSQPWCDWGFRRSVRPSEDSKPYSNGNTGVKTEQNVVDKSVLQSASRSIRIELPDGIDTVIVCKNGRETSMTLS